MNFDNGIDGEIILMVISIEECNLLLILQVISSGIDLLLSLSTPSSHSVSSSTWQYSPLQPSSHTHLKDRALLLNALFLKEEDLHCRNTRFYWCKSPKLKYLYSGRAESMLLNSFEMWLPYSKPWSDTSLLGILLIPPIIVESHIPWPLHRLICLMAGWIQAGSEQCFPLNPVWQIHVPFLHCPCDEHLESHDRCWHRFPSHPSWHTQPDPWHCPFAPQSSEHRAK